MLTSAKSSNTQPRSSATTFSLDSVLRFFRVSVSRGRCRVSWRVAAQGRILRKNLSREPEKRPAHAGPDQDRECDGAGNRAQRLVAVQIDVGPYQRAKSRRSGKAQDDPGTGEKLGQPFPHTNGCGSVSQRFTELVHAASAAIIHATTLRPARRDADKCGEGGNVDEGFDPLHAGQSASRPFVPMAGLPGARPAPELEPFRF
jgi:hypothetical protein